MTPYNGSPYVVINNLGERVAAPFVESDNVMAAKQAVEYPASMGHTGIGFIGGQMVVANIRDRYDSYLQHMEGFGESDHLWTRSMRGHIHRFDAQHVTKLY
jgi:DNA-binding LacI/PurR family transcriptional regulator